MLILTQRPGQTTRIGDDIEVVVLSRNGNQTRAGITASEEIPVHRDKVYQRIKYKEAT